MYELAATVGLTPTQVHIAILVWAGIAAAVAVVFSIARMLDVTAPLNAASPLSRDQEELIREAVLSRRILAGLLALAACPVVLLGAGY